MNEREIMACRAAKELSNGEIVNLGIGIPTGAVNYLPEGVEVILQSENGALLFGPTPRRGEQSSTYANAGAQPITLLPGASIFDLATSFAIMRGGHVNSTILGALEVDQEGNIANWALPLGDDRYAPGMGGAMDLVFGAKKVIVTLSHTDKKGVSKIKKHCELPLTGKGVVDVIITDKAVFEVTPNGLVLKEALPGMTPEDVKNITEADFTVAPDFKPYQADGLI